MMVTGFRQKNERLDASALEQALARAVESGWRELVVRDVLDVNRLANIAGRMTFSVPA